MDDKTRHDDAERGDKAVELYPKRDDLPENRQSETDNIDKEGDPIGANFA